jgi:small-conductance mechanosensitive channel
LLGTALLALTKQNLLLRRYIDNLAQWRSQVLRHNNQVLHALLMRVGGLLLVAALIAVLAMIWRNLAVRYVEDVNRRRQILKVRNVTIVILVIIVLLFNFTSELGALATVVGFAAAGIAVALQDVIMSIAGYFRLSGRFGIKHGDRVELQGVRGEVVELGMTKLTLLELGGDAIQSGPTGRLVMIPNSSVFRDKFLNHPGHSLIIWRELRFTVSPDCDFRLVEKQLLEVVEAVFARYRDSARSQLQEMERNLNIRVDSSRPQSRVRLQPDGLQINLRFPVDVRSEAQVVDEISRRLLDYIGRDPRLRFVPSGTPNIQMVMVAADANHVPSDAPEGDPSTVPAQRNQS